jgi:putative ABC transport system permease protein
VLTSRAGDLRIVEPTRRNDTLATVQHADLPASAAGPRMLITPAAMQRHGWRAQRSAWLVTLPHHATAAELRVARTAAAQVGFAIEPPSGPGSAATVQDAATLVGAALALLIIILCIGLLRSESAGDVRTLTANGAPAGTRRAIAASTAATMAVLGVVLGVGGAYLASIAAFHADLTRLLPVPWSHLVGIAVGLPLAATVLAWLVAGREPPLIARRALD